MVITCGDPQEAKGGGGGPSVAQVVPVDEMVQLIEADIRRGTLPVGGRLPAERALAGRFGVTRAAVRRGLAQLESQGRISREVGRGTFVQSADGSRSDDFGPADVMAVRRLFEPQIIPLVVAWATQRELDEMGRCVDGADRAGSYEEFETWDAALHRSIVLASHNGLLVRLFAVIDTARRGPLWGELKRRRDSPELREEYQGHHRAIVAALRQRDEERATAVMRLHLLRVESNLLGERGGPGAQDHTSD